MSRAKVAVACGLVALLISACGVKPKPEAGTAHLQKHQAFYGVVDDPRKHQVACLHTRKVPFHKYYTVKGHLPAIQIGTLPAGPTLIFYPTPGAAQALQIEGKDEGAEAIGNSLLFPNGASDKLLNEIERCASVSVNG